MNDFIKYPIQKGVLATMLAMLIGCANAHDPNPNLIISQTSQVVHSADDGHDHNHSHEIPRVVGTKADFDKWLSDNPWQKNQVAQYEQFLHQNLGKHAVPPLHQLLTTARSWQECGFEPYQVPPVELWYNMLPTLKLYNKLRQLGILPPNTEIRSVYRNPELNRCAGGAVSSKHLTNGAIDIWVPTYDKDSWQMKELQNRLCQFWVDGGSAHNFGLGIYATGAIHLDTQGYRKWGAEYTESFSPCRYVVPKPELGFSNVSITQTPIASTVTPQPSINQPTTQTQDTPVPVATTKGNFATTNNTSTISPINYFVPNGMNNGTNDVVPSGQETPTLPLLKPAGNGFGINIQK